jgi:hypothetical protein
MNHLDICSTSYGKKKGRESNVQFDPWPQKSGIDPTQGMQVECDMPLESFRQELQICFRPHPNRRFEQRVMTPQSGESPN